MSIIFTDNKSNILLFCKGADDVIFQRLAHNVEFKEETMNNLQKMAEEGLRTLVLTMRYIDVEEYI